jgi:hypothetical protein
MKSFVVSMIAVAGLATAASAQVEVKPYTSGPIGLPINDNSSTLSTIVVPQAGTILDFESVWVDINHTWVGDLTITLTHNSVTCVILDRPGVPPIFGNGDDLAGIYTFVDVGTLFPEAAAGGVVPSGTYQSASDLGACFNGMDMFGDWTLSVTDSSGGDTGTLNAWGFTVRNVPTPGAAALLGLGGLFAARRRRS